MANEITVTQAIQCINGNLRVSFPQLSRQFTQAATGLSDQLLTIGTTEETVSVTDVSTLGWCVFQNTDATNYVHWGFSTGVYGGRMEAGEPAGPFRLEPGSTIYMKANTASCKVRALILQD